MHPQVDLLIHEYRGKCKPFLDQLRMFILDTHPQLQEVYKYRTPFYELEGPLGYMTMKGDHVIFGFVRGKILHEKSLPLVGTQKYVRHYIIREWNEEVMIEFGTILEEAVQLNMKLKEKKWNVD